MIIGSIPFNAQTIIEPFLRKKLDILLIMLGNTYHLQYLIPLKALNLTKTPQNAPGMQCDRIHGSVLIHPSALHLTPNEWKYHTARLPEYPYTFQ